MAHSYSTFIHVKTTKSETIVMLIYIQLILQKPNPANYYSQIFCGG